MNFFKYFGLIGSILSAVTEAEANLAGGQSVTAPGIRTYVGGQHIELDITIKPLQ